MKTGPQTKLSFNLFYNIFHKIQKSKPKSRSGVFDKDQRRRCQTILKNMSMCAAESRAFSLLVLH